MLIMEQTYHEHDDANTTKHNTKGNQRACQPRDWIIEMFRNESVTFDDGAWQFLYNAVPQYSLFNNMVPSPIVLPLSPRHKDYIPRQLFLRYSFFSLSNWIDRSSK
jgi:hypothetical protein